MVHPSSTSPTSWWWSFQRRGNPSPIPSRSSEPRIEHNPVHARGSSRCSSSPLGSVWKTASLVLLGSRNLHFPHGIFLSPLLIIEILIMVSFRLLPRSARNLYAVLSSSSPKGAIKSMKYHIRVKGHLSPSWQAW